MNRYSKALLISGIITVVISVIVLLLCIYDWSGLTPLAAVFIIWAQIVFFGGLIFQQKIRTQTEQLVLQASFIPLLTIYSFICGVLSVLFLIRFKSEWKYFVSIQLILAGIISTLLIALYSASKAIRVTNQNTMHDIIQINSYISRINTLAVTAGEEEGYGFDLKTISEALRFTDISAMVPVDEEIDHIISELELEFEKETIFRSTKLIQERCTKLAKLIEKRKIQSKAIKEGII
ncbi:hypothetical protein [Anaerotignum propionicum]|uniref:Uncharacterized protein n=1 Tax=Anaerotignum propionicum DSM 1682 TaxID=991789 RepID=A0A120MK80_ANAPI|nr:hypothetical protein [Anaerotignum propionicum]AMJ40448.1 hypothetical protein CPRO_08480 [Anaerotignum propionicum DSM 1682]SHE41817.1 hypothetical protein SAMN02745151_00635 [[Clostridium] propionicum DSM 1682] [Anaerotignum propionicum DSM 1682]